MVLAESSGSCLFMIDGLANALKGTHALRHRVHEAFQILFFGILTETHAQSGFDGALAHAHRYQYMGQRHRLVICTGRPERYLDAMHLMKYCSEGLSANTINPNAKRIRHLLLGIARPMEGHTRNAFDQQTAEGDAVVGRPKYELPQHRIDRFSCCPHRDD